MRVENQRLLLREPLKKKPKEAEASVPRVFAAFHGRGRERGTEIKTNTGNCDKFLLSHGRSWVWRRVTFQS